MSILGNCGRTVSMRDSSLIIDVAVVRHNLEMIEQWVSKHGASLTVVTKALCGHQIMLDTIQQWGVRSFGESRLENLRCLDRSNSELETWYIRSPHLSLIPQVISLADVSLNSEIEVIRALDREAERQQKRHKILIMVELGDLREGVLPEALADIVGQTIRLSHIDLLGLGATLGCLNGILPSKEALLQLCRYRKMIELNFGCKLSMVSAGTSATLPLLVSGDVPEEVNHFRVCESIFIGTDLVHGGLIQPLRNATLVEAEIIELKDKPLVPSGRTASGDIRPFWIFDDSLAVQGQHAHRAIVSVGHVDTDISSLIPVNPDYYIAGASSDVAAVVLGDNPRRLKVGDSILFRPDYSAFVRLMANPHTEVVLRNEEQL